MRGEHLVRVGERGHRLGRDERRHLDLVQARARELVDELDLRRRGHEGLLDLEAVAHGDVVDVEAHGGPGRETARYYSPRGGSASTIARAAARFLGHHAGIPTSGRTRHAGRLSAIMTCALCAAFGGFYAQAEEPHAAPASAPVPQQLSRTPTPASFWLWKWEQLRTGCRGRRRVAGTFPHVSDGPGRAARQRRNPTVTWIGHATFLVQLAGINILVRSAVLRARLARGLRGPEARRAAADRRAGAAAHRRGADLAQPLRPPRRRRR